MLDSEGRFGALRKALTAPPFRPVAFPPHLTVIHPRTSSLAAEFWRAGVTQRKRLEVTIDSIVITSSESEGYQVQARFPLR